MKDDYTGILLEDIQSKLQAVAEDVSSLHGKIDTANERLDKVEQNTELIPIIKIVITDQTHQLNGHESRISTLENA